MRGVPRSGNASPAASPASATRRPAPSPTRMQSAPAASPTRKQSKEADAAAVPIKTSARQKALDPPLWCNLSREEQFQWANGKISLCARVRPGDGGESFVCVDVKDAKTVSLKSPMPEACDHLYSCDRTFGADATQEEVYKEAVSPICDGVLNGYNGAVIAYGQTGSGKTHTMIGSAGSRGVAPQAVTDIFKALSKRQCWTVQVSVLEIYNEKVRDLLAPSVTCVDIREDVDKENKRTSFHCPDATCRTVVAPEEALMALNEGMKRRETARTDMNHQSSRSHLIFTLTIVQGDPAVGATLNGRLHFVDLAGSERLKRSSMTSENATTGVTNPAQTSSRVSLTSRSPRDSPKNRPMHSRSQKELPKASPRERDQRREAGEINKSLSQLSLVIQRLTGLKAGNLQMVVPYRDSMLTRLLAESFGGSSKTCLIITCSPSAKDRDETLGALEFGKRAKLVENKAQINLEMKNESSPVIRACIQKEFAELHREKEAMLRERERFVKERQDLKAQLAEAQRLLTEAGAEAAKRHESHTSYIKLLEEENAAMQARLEESVRQTLASVLSESQRLDTSRRERSAALEADKQKLAAEWQTRLSGPSVVPDNSYPLGNISTGRSTSATTPCVVEDASMGTSSDTELIDSPQFA